MATIKKYLWVAHLFAIAVCAYFVAQTVTTYLSMFLVEETGRTATARPKSPEESRILLGQVSGYDPVIERNVFNSAKIPVNVELPKEDIKKTAVDLEGPAVKTSLNIKVLGTLVVDGGKDRRSSATIVGGKSRKPGVYFVLGDEVFEDGVELVRVKKHRIEFTNKGRLEYAMLEGISEDITLFARAEDVHGKSDGKKHPSKRKTPKSRESAPKASGDKHFVIDQREVDEALANLDRLYTEVRIVPNFRDGQPAGMKILAVKPGSIFSKLGLRRGDVLERINGMELDIKRGMELFAQLRDQKNLKIDLVRRGKNETLEYEIK